MPGDTTFQDLIRRVRAGDGQAAVELVRLYEPTIRRVARVPLADSRLQRLFDSQDVCQSVFGSGDPGARARGGGKLLRSAGPQGPEMDWWSESRMR